ncbi:MAG: GLPGLI family protein [Chitinophagaceae bacterium]|nr:GLPGLI family protein [Chitinophagaceae bacterium]MDP1812686.1 GLPGLI family protein [Sediminibacterium sp.]MDP3127573.1 GLPGLI family protein [Sediminibacterium sp.]
MASNIQTILFVAFSSILFSANAQTQFIMKGRVEYEKKINQFKSIEGKEDNIWYKEMMKVYPKFVNDVYELRFDSKKSVYKLAKENTDNKYLMWGSKPSETDGIVQDLENKSLSTQKDVFENTYLIKDSLRKLEWRITDETRDIAGFECRKAVTKICDSVYVVAFYTDQIPVSSGPESFGGLPGLILGLAVPRLYTTWFATKLELIDPSIAQLNPVQKGKKVTREQLFAELKKGLKDWGEEGEKRIWVVSL